MPIPLALKILILESQMIIAADVSLQFSKLGYDVIGIHTRPEDAVKTIQTNRPDIVLMSIEMQGKAAGLKMARRILETYLIPVVFLSANTDKELFKEIVDTQPYAFITKPFDKESLKRGIETTLKRMAAEGLWKKEQQVPVHKNGLFILHKDHFLKIEINDILFVKANRNYCQLSTPEKAYRLSVPLRKIEDQLPGSQFIRVHRSFLVNLNKINTLQEHGKHLTVQNYQIPISRRLRREVLNSIKGD
jgi:DNA-binding LytR/AlgR family response regulator